MQLLLNFQNKSQGFVPVCGGVLSDGNEIANPKISPQI